MPTISQFYGIKISIFYDDHNEPHFHAVYAGEKAEVSIRSGSILEGDLPPVAKRLIKKWMEDHKKELFEDWELAVQHKELKKIEPLNNMIPTITKIKYKKDYIYYIRFQDNREGDIDFKPFLWGEVFEKLKDKNFFRKAFVDPDSGTITWPNGTDIAPETLYSKIASNLSAKGSL